MKTQSPFTAHRPESRLATNRVWMRVTKVPDLEYAVLMGHVLVYEDLCWLLGIRLRTDTLPEKLPLFETVVGVALAGSKFEDDRETLRFLNSARNEIAHRTDRPKFEANVRNFCTRLWKNKKYGSPELKWNSNEAKQVKAFWFAVGVLSAVLGDHYDHFRRGLSARRRVKT